MDVGLFNTEVRLRASPAQQVPLLRPSLPLLYEDVTGASAPLFPSTGETERGEVVFFSSSLERHSVILSSLTVNKGISLFPPFTWVRKSQFVVFFLLLFFRNATGTQRRRFLLLHWISNRRMMEDLSLQDTGKPFLLPSPSPLLALNRGEGTTQRKPPWKVDSSNNRLARLPPLFFLQRARIALTPPLFFRPPDNCFFFDSAVGRLQHLFSYLFRPSVSGSLPPSFRHRRWREGSRRWPSQSTGSCRRSLVLFLSRAGDPN